jgi:glycosyltransferase involved in cell wall biosynthesis
VKQVHVVVPAGIDDPARPSGGNVYDRHVCDGLAATGWSVYEHEDVERIPDDAVVVIDGLVAPAMPLREAQRLRLVVLVHMPRDDDRERAVLEAATAVVTTSEWSRRRLLEQYALPADRVHVAPPGVDPAALAPGTAAGNALLCVGAVTPLKGHDVLLDALATITDLSWRCECVGSLDIDAAFAAGLRRLDGRVTFPGPRTGAELDASYAAADLLVLPSRTEAYGMVVTEALARGVPVLAADVGGVTEALGDDDVGLLVAPEDPAALAAALRAWLSDAALRDRLRRAARERRQSLPEWPTTASTIATVLAEVLQ